MQKYVVAFYCPEYCLQVFLAKWVGTAYFLATYSLLLQVYHVVSQRYLHDLNIWMTSERQIIWILLTEHHFRGN